MSFAAVARQTPSRSAASDSDSARLVPLSAAFIGSPPLLIYWHACYVIGNVTVETPHRFAPGTRVVAVCHDRELGRTSRIAGMVVEHDEIADLVCVAIDGCALPTWLALEHLAPEGATIERTAA